MRPTPRLSAAFECQAIALQVVTPEPMPRCYIPCRHVSCLAGGIMELNQRLVACPDLLRTHPETLGYVAIMTPMKKDRMQGLAATMVTRTAYEALRAGPAGSLDASKAKGTSGDSDTPPPESAPGPDSAVGSCSGVGGGSDRPPGG